MYVERRRCRWMGEDADVDVDVGVDISTEDVSADECRQEKM
jgi:hypothetical protein